MKLRVQREDGRIEVIAVVGPVSVHHGEKMDHLHSADGLDHWFVDGYYDGWGRSTVVLSDADITDTTDRIERERRIEDA